MLLVSYIIPAYNATQTISRCLDSIYSIGVKKKEFEIIVIDDCSTDDTAILVHNRYEINEKLQNIRLIRQNTNQKQGAARNRGLREARGKYIVFVDSDDEIDIGVIKAIKIAEKHELEMVAMKYTLVDKNGKITGCKSLPDCDSNIISGISFQKNNPYWCTASWGYVFSKLFLTQVNYPFAEGVLYEDSDFVNVHLYEAQRVGYSDECGYRFHYNPNSTTHTKSYKHYADYFLLGTRMLKLYERIEDKKTEYAASILEGGSYNICYSFKQLKKLSTLSEVKEFYKRIDKYIVRSDYSKYSEPKYLWNWYTKKGLNQKWFIIVYSYIAIQLRKINFLTYFRKKNKQSIEND